MTPVADYRLIRGEALAVLRELPDASVDAVITDPPYSVHPKVAQELLGHSTITLTLDTYSHVLPALHHEAVPAHMEALFTPLRQDDQTGDGSPAIRE